MNYLKPIKIINNNRRGIGTISLLGVIFVTLKLCGVINWSWWWVTLPFWWLIALILGIIMAFCVFFFFLFAGAFLLDLIASLRRK